MIGEAQEILARRDLVPSNPKIRRPPAGVELTFIDRAQMLDHGRKWAGPWENIITKPQ